MSKILENISTVTGLKVPTSTADIPTFVRKANKKTNDVKLWSKLNNDSQQYLSKAFKAMREQSMVHPPEDFIELPGPDDAGFEPPPEGFNTKSNYTVYNLSTLIAMREEEELKLPDFQRKFIWGKENKYGFLRGLLLGLPSANIMLGVDPKTQERYILDGFQRISTLVDFKNGKISLGPGPSFPNYTFSYLPAEDQNRFRHTTLVAQEVNSEKKFWPYIFRQVNKGGMPLNSMEIRRAAYQHELMFMLDEFTETNEWWSGLFGRNTRYKGLQALLRAKAMHEGYEKYSKPMDQFIDKYCDNLFTEILSDKELRKLQSDLNRLFKAMYQTMGKKAFRLADKKPVNLGFLDAMVHGGLLLLEGPHQSDENLAMRLQGLREDLLKGPGYVQSSFILDTSGRESVITRMRYVEEVL